MHVISAVVSIGAAALIAAAVIALQRKKPSQAQKDVLAKIVSLRMERARIKYELRNFRLNADERNSRRARINSLNWEIVALEQELRKE
jgi:hypothetical protein